MTNRAIGVSQLRCLCQGPLENGEMCACGAVYSDDAREGYRQLLEKAHALACAAARVIEDDDKPGLVHMRELQRCWRDVRDVLPKHIDGDD